MDIKELNKAQLVMLLILLTFVVSIATSIITASLMQEAPVSVSAPINKVVRETVEKIVPAVKDENDESALSEEQKKLLEELKAIKPLTVSLYLKGTNSSEDKILGTGLFLGDNKVVIASIIPVPETGQEYVVKSVLGEQKVSKVTPEKDFTIIEVTKTETVPTDNTINPNPTPIDPNTTSPAIQ